MGEKVVGRRSTGRRRRRIVRVVAISTMVGGRRSVVLRSSWKIQNQCWYTTLEVMSITRLIKPQPPQLGRLPGRFASFSPRSLPLRISRFHSTTSPVNSLLPVSCGGLYPLPNCRRFEDPNEPPLGFILWVNIGNFLEGLHLVSIS